METYRVLWLSVCVPLGVIGATVALAVSPAAVVVLVRRLRAVGSLLTFCLVSGTGSVAGRSAAALGGRGAGRGTGVSAFLGFASLLGPGVLLLAAVVLAGSPYAVKVAGRWLRSVRTPSTAQLDAVARAFAYASPEFAQFRAPELRDLTDQQLCKRWRASYRAAQRQQSSAVKLIAAVAERQMYLDELERRNSRGFAAWLAAAPRRRRTPCRTSTGTESTPRPSTGTS